MIRRLVLVNLRATKVRLALTSLTVVLGVSFVTSSFVLSDGLRGSFAQLSDQIVAGSDLQVRPVDVADGATAGDSGASLDDAVVERIRAVDGVAEVRAGVQRDGVAPIPADGEPIVVNGPPQLGISWVPANTTLTVVEGRAPMKGAEIALDLDSASRHGFVVGERYDVITPTGRQEATLVGLTRFGPDNATLGAMLTSIPLDTAQEWFGMQGRLSGIDVVVDAGASPGTVRIAIAAELPDDVEVIGREELASEQQASFNAGIDLVGGVILGLAAVSLFVSAFIIANTFSIVVAQRSRELALLRAVGATPSLVRRLVLVEAAIVGLLSSLVGLAAGTLLTSGLRALFALIGAPLPDIDLILSPRTIMLGLGLGVGVTVVSALAPALRAATVPPVAALGTGLVRTDNAAAARRRTVVGVILALIGASGLVAGLFGSLSTSATVTALGAGGIATFVGITLLSPLVVRPITAVLGWPLARLGGQSGRLATRNAGRNPRRTASTAGALTIGLALVASVFVVGESVKAGLSDVVTNSVRADYRLSTGQASGGVAPELALGLAQDPAFESVVAVSQGRVLIGSERYSVAATTLASIDTVADLDLAEGTLSSGSADGDRTSALIHSDVAEQLSVGVGDTVDASISGTDTALTVIGVFDERSGFGDVIVDRALWTELVAVPTDAWIGVRVAPDGTSAALAALERATERFPQVQSQTRDEFAGDIAAQVDGLLAVVNALLAIAVLIALIGIANTLALSVFERTRELGLLRAVGMGRRQLRRMIRLEAAIVAVYGAGLGVAVGMLFGAAAVAALPDELPAALTIPTGRIVVLVVVAALAGLLAAALPARRAARLDVLTAISTA